MFLGELETEKNKFKFIPYILILYNENIKFYSSPIISNKKNKTYSAKFKKEFLENYILFNKKIIYIKDYSSVFLSIGIFDAITAYYFFSKNTHHYDYRIDNFSYEINYINIL